MKTILYFIIFLFFCTFSYAQSNNLSEARRLIQLQKVELTKAQNENKMLKNSLEEAKKNIIAGELQVQELQAAADALKNWGIEKEKESWKNFNAMMEERKLKEKEIELKEKAIKKYHTCKLINAIVASFLGLILGLYLMKFVPITHTHYAFALPVLGIITSFCLIWFLL
jgi:hypothetical protein